MSDFNKTGNLVTGGKASLYKVEICGVNTKLLSFPHHKWGLFVAKQNGDPTAGKTGQRQSEAGSKCDSALFQPGNMSTTCSGRVYRPHQGHRQFRPKSECKIFHLRCAYDYRRDKEVSEDNNPMRVRSLRDTAYRALQTRCPCG